MSDYADSFKKKPLLKRASYHLFGLSKRLTNKAIFQEPFNAQNYSTLKSKYDSYGFALDDNQFATGIEAYEKEFSVKKERRLKRWEELNVTDPNFDFKSDEFKLMVRKGIPDHLRSFLWKKFLGADVLEKENPGKYARDMPLPRDIAEQIDMDINRTFPHHKNYNLNSFGTVMLRNVLSAFASYMPSVSYCQVTRPHAQSLNYICATLLIFLNEEEAFWCLVQIVNTKLPQKGFDLVGRPATRTGYYHDGMVDLKRDVLVLQFILKKRMKRLYNHLRWARRTLRTNHIDLMWICAEWFLCLFAISLPVGAAHAQINTVFRVWDSLFLEGDKVLFRVAFSLFKLHEQKIMTLDFDRDLLVYCKTMSKSVLQHDEFLKIAFYELAAFSRKEVHRYRIIAEHEIMMQTPGTDAVLIDPGTPNSQSNDRDFYGRKVK